MQRTSRTAQPYRWYALENGLDLADKQLSVKQKMLILEYSAPQPFISDIAVTKKIIRSGLFLFVPQRVIPQYPTGFGS